MNHPSLWVVENPVQWDERDAKSVFALGRGITNGGPVGVGIVFGGMGGDLAGVRY
jgi:hypothetical protein